MHVWSYGSAELFLSPTEATMVALLKQNGTSHKYLCFFCRKHRHVGKLSSRGFFLVLTVFWSRGRWWTSGCAPTAARVHPHSVTIRIIQHYVIIPPEVRLYMSRRPKHRRLHHTRRNCFAICMYKRTLLYDAWVIRCTVNLVDLRPRGDLHWLPVSWALNHVYAWVGHMVDLKS